MLFCKPLSYRFGGSNGKNSHGRYTVWGRRATQKVRVWAATRLWWGTHRVWKTLWVQSGRAAAALLVGRGGLIFWGSAPAGVVPGDWRTTTLAPLPVRPGLATCLRWLPVGTSVTGVQWYGRAAGTSLKVLRHRNGFTECRLPSRQQVWVNSGVTAVVGSHQNVHAKHRVRTTAGDAWWLGKKPRVRGVARNPIDHPHGGGQGKTSGGRPGVTPWGKLTKGYKTRTTR